MVETGGENPTVDKGSVGVIAKLVSNKDMDGVDMLIAGVKSELDSVTK